MKAEDTSRYYYIYVREKMTSRYYYICALCALYGKFFLQRHPDFMRIDFENFKIFLIITQVKILPGVEF